MNYLKNLTMRQWVIIVLIILFFALAYFFFMKKPVDREKIDIERLLNQGTAPIASEENIGRDKLEEFLNPDTPPDAARKLSEDEKSALFKLMSAPQLK